MIVFDLECLNGHTFEGWFDDKKDLENQQALGLLQCPVCETASVEQKLSRICIRTSCAPSNQAQQSLRANQEVLAEFTEKITEYVEKNYEDVGPSFTKEALRMHYGATEHRNIRGTTTKEEEKVLTKEGVPVVKIPFIKKENEDLN
ncbi:MAG: DUF1178 family protein [Proteobacteria bacterium]|nr:DUF1178 family protein [Desulfobacula sp.]MBU3951923.1 DUF1178 family protein [Pseudomonadota bacterium]MBU4131035.1 DUF1178 family protein [Pseudomonadota bacterium]